jgi:DNA-binding NarL/FixJ family response regulator
MPGSDVLMTVAERLTDGNLHATFLCPHPVGETSDGHVRVTMLACPPQPPHHLTAVVAVSPAGDLRRLTGRELEILGLLTEDWSDRRIAAALHLPLLSVAETVERVRHKLEAPRWPRTRASSTRSTA